MVDSDAKQLNVEELLYAITLTNDPAKQEAIFTKATQIYPNNYRAYDNLGKLAYQAGSLDKAEGYSKKSLPIKDFVRANTSMGLIALTKGDKVVAEPYLGKASNAKKLNETLGNLCVAQGQYNGTVSAFGDAKTDSTALAQTPAKDYNGAKSTLSDITEPNAYTGYLMAVMGVRTNNTSMVAENLKKAVAKDSPLAKKAASGLGFSRYFMNADSMNTIR